MPPLPPLLPPAAADAVATMPLLPDAEAALSGLDEGSTEDRIRKALKRMVR